MGKLATFIVGGAVGVAAGMLLSPRTGSENRALLSEVISENCGNISCPPQVQEKADAFVSAAASTSTKVINTVVDNGSDAYKSVAARAQKAVPASVQAFDVNGDELKQKIDAARERIATQVAKNAEAARDAAVDKVPAVIDAANAAKATATEAAGTAAAKVQEAAAPAAAAVQDAATNAAGAVKDAATNAAGAAKDAAGAVAAKVNPPKSEE